MSRIDEVTMLGRGLGEKTIGVTLEFAGTVLQNHELRDRGRRLEDAGSKRWREFEKDVRSMSKKRARSHGSRERSHRSSGNGSAKRSRSATSRTAAR